MTVSRQKRRIRRVLVALDTSPGSLAAASAAARLASLLNAELAGLFVEDRELLHLSRSPMAQQIDLLTTAVDRVESAEVERQLRVQALRAKRALAEMAETVGLEWSFRITRGNVAEEIHAASTDTDLVSLGRVGWSLRHRRRLGRTARVLLEEPGRCTLLIERAATIRPPIAVVYNDSSEAEAAVEIALSVAGKDQDGLAVLVVGKDIEALKKRLSDQLGDERAHAATIESGESIDARTCQLIRSMRAGLVVLPVGEDGPNEEQIQDLLDSTDCPILAVS